MAISNLGFKLQVQQGIKKISETVEKSSAAASLKFLLT